MKCVMVMFDSLNRHMLPPYAPDTWVDAPNFRRLAARSTRFDTAYVCSMPCMPARHDLHTGRPNFLHNSWGPMEPYDLSVPAMLRERGVHTHLASDHYHYWEDGGATYHTRYSSWECFRGQEGDPFIGQVEDPVVPPHINGKGRREDWVNRMHLRTEAQMPQTQTFEAGLQFIDRNAKQDNWFLQIECFDPHEPFVTAPGWRQRYGSDADLPLFDWPGYRAVREEPEQVEACRRNYAALVTRCDHSLGVVMDAMDRHNLWHDTMLIVWTDHGFLLGEHQSWAKNWCLLYEQIARIPCFIWDPRHPEAAGQHRSSLVQPSIDLGPTLLSYFGCEASPLMLGHDLAGVIQRDEPVRDAAIFGYFGDRVNITDGRHVYMRAPEPGSPPASRYTLMPTNMRGFAPTDALRQAELGEPFAFTHGIRPLRIPGAKRGFAAPEAGNVLFDLQADPAQEHALDDPAVEARLAARMAQIMHDCDAPPEQFQRMGLSAPE